MAGRGRPRHQPTETIRRAVETMAIGGIPVAHIGRLLAKVKGDDGVPLGITLDVKTLTRHYQTELNYGHSSQVGEGCVQLMAAVRRGEAWAILALLRTKGGDDYREPDRRRPADDIPGPPPEQVLPNQERGYLPVVLQQTINAEEAMREYQSLMRPKAPALPQLSAPVSQQ